MADMCDHGIQTSHLSKTFKVSTWNIVNNLLFEVFEIENRSGTFILGKVTPTELISETCQLYVTSKRKSNV